MKTKLFALTALILLSAVLFSACQPRLNNVDAVSAKAADTAAAPAAKVHAGPAVQEPAPTLPPTPTLAPTIVTPAGVPPASADDAKVASAQTEEAARAYFTAVSEGRSEDAADQLSAFSLMVFQMTKGDAADKLQEQKTRGIHWEDFEVLDTQPFNADTVLVHVRYSVSGQKAEATATPAPTPSNDTKKAAESQTVEALWPFRLEFGEWRYNWDNLIDFRTLDIPAQTMSGITIMPTQMTRYSDHLTLTMLAQNRTNEAIVFGQVNETLGTFHFGAETVIAEKTRWILNPLRSVPNATLEAKGLFNEYPDTVEIRKWKSYQVKPWYEFALR